MKVNSINTESIVPVEYSHTHDGKILFRKYRENFDFGLTVDQYYFNKDAKDKKTNYNTQYTLTDLQPLSTIAEIDIPFTEDVVSVFSTTIQHSGKYLKTDYTTNINSISSTFVDSSEFNTLSSQFFFTLNLSTISVPQSANETQREDRITISQEYNSITYYLSAPTHQNTTALWTTTGPSYFNYTLENNKLAIFTPKEYTSSPGTSANVLINTDTTFLTGTNLDFSDTSAWTAIYSGQLNAGDPVDTGWKLADGVATHLAYSDPPGPQVNNLYQNINAIIGNKYMITLTVDDSTAGTLKVFVGTVDGVFLPTVAGSSDGTHTLTIEATNSSYVYFQATNTFNGNIDNVSIVMVPQSSLRWKAPASSWQGEMSTLSASFFDVNRTILTKDFKAIPNSYTKYTSSYNTDTVDLNTSTVVDHISNNYFVYTNNFNFYDKGITNVNKNKAHADFFPLKNQATLHEYYSENNHFNSEPDYLNRIYEKVNAGTNQQHGYDKIGLSYNIGTYDIVFKPNKLTYFTTPDSMAPYTVLNIKDSKLEKLGSVAGDNPLMSDKVFKRRENVKNNSFSNNVDPVYLCSWLSGSGAGDTRWVDRYYNPNISDFTNALSGTSYYKVVTAAGAETTETFDVSSSLTFEPNNDYIFYHVGSNDYKNLLDAYNTKYNEAASIEYLNYKGVPTTPNKVKGEDELVLDGSTFGRFNTDVTGDFSTNFWLHTDDNTLPFGYQITGNYFDEGFGIFNTDLVTPNIILPVENYPHSKKISKLLFLNNDFETYDEVVVMDGVDEIEIKGIGRKDNFSEFYVLGDNNVIYVYNANNNLISKIENLKDVANTSIVDDFEVGEEKIHVLFNPIDKKKYFTYNTKTNKSNTTTSSVSADTIGEKGKIVSTSSGTVLYKVDATNSFGNELSFDSNNKPYIVRRSNPAAVGDASNFVQKNGAPFSTTDKTNNLIKSGLAKKSKVNGVLVDEENNIIVVHDNNIISILDNNRILKVTREFCNLNNAAFHQTYIDLIFDFEDGVYKKYILMIQEFGDGFRLTKLDTNLNIISSKKFRNVNLGDLKLTKTVTSYYYLQKIGANKNRFKVVLKAKPKFSSTGIIPRNKHQIDFDMTQLNPGYNHFFVNVSLRKGYMELYVNSKLYSTTNFKSGTYALDNVLGTGSYIGAVSTPFYLTLANRLLQPKKYFIKNAKIKGFKLYNKTMSYYDMLAHYNYHFEDKDLIWSYPIGQRTYIDTIDKLMKFNYPEKITNKYKIEIENTGITDDKLKEKLKERISKELQKITPYFDEVQEIAIS